MAESKRFIELEKTVQKHDTRIEVLEKFGGANHSRLKRIEGGVVILLVVVIGGLITALITIASMSR